MIRDSVATNSIPKRRERRERVVLFSEVNHLLKERDRGEKVMKERKKQARAKGKEGGREKDIEREMQILM